MKEKVIKVTVATHTELVEIGRKTETFNDIIQGLIRGRKSRSEAKRKIQALAGIARSHNIGNLEMMDQIKKLENEALQLLEV